MWRQKKKHWSKKGGERLGQTLPLVAEGARAFSYRKGGRDTGSARARALARVAERARVCLCFFSFREDELVVVKVRFFWREGMIGGQ